MISAAKMRPSAGSMQIGSLAFAASSKAPAAGTGGFFSTSMRALATTSPGGRMICAMGRPSEVARAVRKFSNHARSTS